MERTSYKIAVAHSRTAKIWTNKDITWEELVEKCRTPKRTGETVAQYAAMTKAEQSARKDVGGFVGGTLKEGKRKNGYVKARSMATLDIDFGNEGVWERFTDNYDCRAILYSTHKHSSKNKRYRLIVPFSRDVEPWEYEPICRSIAFHIGIDMFDHTTYELPRLFYWPSASEDGEYVFEKQDGGDLNVDQILNWYDDPKDASTWHYGRNEVATIQREIRKAGEPTEKRGMVGAFCRAYSISEAIDKFLSDAYEPTLQGDRYTYKLGSVAGGLVVYGDKFAYSHHDTDPASRILCNAFDLVRIHNFSDLDGKSKTDDVTKLPSYAKMVELAGKDEGVTSLMQRERMEKASAEFEGMDGDEETEEDIEWMAKLDKNKSGQIVSSVSNALAVLRNDRRLAGKMFHDEFSGYDMAEGSLPWRRSGMLWTDKDDANLRVYLDTNYGITGKEKISDALDCVFTGRRKHPVREYLNSLRWDGVERLDTLIIDYIGAEDNELNRLMTRKTFAAAVARVFNPGCKFDYCLIMTGGEGIGKSSLLKIMGGEWFSDSIVTTEGKEGMESLRQAWIIELAELASVKRSDVEQVKCFLSKQSDKYRQAYGKRVTEFPRQCVFFGTTNEASFLKGDTGNRRFWVIPVAQENRKHDGDIFEAIKGMRDQLWAEAVARFREGEKLYLESDMEEEARKRQTDFNVDVDDPMPGMLEEYLEQKIPADWYTWDVQRRKAFFQQRDPLSDESLEREKFFAGEFLYEMYGYSDKDKDYKYKLKQVNKLMKEKKEWEYATIKVKGYGLQKGFRKVTQK